MSHTAPPALPGSVRRAPTPDLADALASFSHRVDRSTLFRWLVLGCQAASLAISWPLWQVHASPPMLPALPLPQVDLGIALQLSLLVALVRPLVGIASHTGLLAYAMAIDQTRLQPEFISLGILLCGSTGLPNALVIARFHLVSMWVFAGLNKLFSPAFLQGDAQWMLGAYVVTAPFWLRESFGFMVVAAEAGLGLLAALPATRRAAAIQAFLVHANILYVLSPLGLGWNQVVWPWNVALAASGGCLIATWKESLVVSVRRCRRSVGVAVALLALAPAGFYVLVVDAYIAHNLYTSNTPRETWCDARNQCRAGTQTQATWRAFNVPLPPEHRLFESYFAQTCQPGERLIIQDTRWLARRLGVDRREVACPARAASGG